MWGNSSHDGLRITCKLLANLLPMFLLEEDLNLLNMSDRDLSELLTTLHSAALSPDSTAEAFGYSYSTLELLKVLQCISCRAINFKKIAKPSLLQPLANIIRMGQMEEKIASLKILWNLLELPELRDVMKLAHKNALDQIQKESSASTNEDFLLWSSGILAIMRDSALKIEGEALQLCSTSE